MFSQLKFLCNDLTLKINCSRHYACMFKHSICHICNFLKNGVWFYVGWLANYIN